MASNAEKKDIENKLRKYPPVLTVKEVCEILHFGTTKVYGMIGTGEIRRIEHSGRHIRVLKADVIVLFVSIKIAVVDFSQYFGKNIVYRTHFVFTGTLYRVPAQLTRAVVRTQP